MGDKQHTKVVWTCIKAGVSQLKCFTLLPYCIMKIKLPFTNIYIEIRKNKWWTMLNWNWRRHITYQIIIRKKVWNWDNWCYGTTNTADIELSRMNLPVQLWWDK